MMNGSLITPTNIRDYAKSRGWILVPEAVHDRLYVLEHPRFKRRQIVFPIDMTAPDYADAVAIVSEKLAEFEAKPVDVILSSFQEVRDDTLRIRIASERNGVESIPLAFAADTIGAAQQLLLSAACTVLKPRIHHPRLSLGDAEQLLQAAQFRHTEHSSFVLKISCPIDALDVPAPIDLFSSPEDNQPFVRRTMLTINRAMRQLVSAIEADRLPSFIEETKRANAPIVSSNLCEALTRFHDEELNNSVEMSISWAVYSPVPEADFITNLRIQQDYFPRIEEVQRALRSAEEHMEDAFVGTVEQLNGEMTGGGHRAGEVILALLLPDKGEVVRARTNLTAEQYKDADRAHMTDGVYVKITGRLHPGRQPRSLTDISHFELLLPTRQNGTPRLLTPIT